MKWSRLWVEGSHKLGTPLDAAAKHKERLANAGFTNIVVHEFKWPSNTWPRDRDMKILGT